MSGGNTPGAPWPAGRSRSLLRLRSGALARRLVYVKIVSRTGGRIEYFICGVEPLSRKRTSPNFLRHGNRHLPGLRADPNVAHPVRKYPDGLSFRDGRQPVPGVELRIADDGEILARGPNVMRGYYRKEAETPEALAGGWFHTGDIGRFDDEGFLIITDPQGPDRHLRRKECRPPADRKPPARQSLYPIHDLVGDGEEVHLGLDCPGL